MSELPVSFLISLVLFVTLARYTIFWDKRIGVFPRIALAALAIQSVLLGLKWGYHVSILWPIQGVFAAAIPPLVWFALSSMISGKNRKNALLTWLQIGGPPLLVVLAPFTGPDAVDIVIGSVFIGYGLALLYTTFKDDIEWLGRIPFQSLVSTNTAFRAAGVMLIFSAFIDVAIIYDIRATGGSLAPDIVGLSGLMIIVILSASIAIVGRLAPEAPFGEAPPDVQESSSSHMDERSAEELQALYSETLTRLDALMLSKRIYRDPNLSLDRMARKLIVPARQISAAINSQRAMNVPQYVNMFRVVEACQVLRHNSSAQITEVIFDVGFQTKSNFNREFLRIVGMSPSEWRQSKLEGMQPETIKTFIVNLQSNAAVVQDIGSLFLPMVRQPMHD